MPKSNLTHKKEPDLFLNNVNWHVTRMGLSYKDMTASLGYKAHATWYDRLKHPERFTRQDVKLLAKLFGVTPLQLEYGQMQSNEEIMIKMGKSLQRVRTDSHGEV